MQSGGVRTMDAKAWLVKLQQEDHRGYSSIQTIRGVLRPAFAMAVEDDLLVKNPFDFMLCDVIVNDSVRREAITAAQMREFLRFVREDRHFSRYYDGMNPNTLKYLMGHTDISVTLNTYTHLGLIDAEQELERMQREVKMSEKIERRKQRRKSSGE